MSAIGINNGNFRLGEYKAWATNDLSNVPTFTQYCDVKKAVRESFETQEAYEAWEKDAPKYDAFFAYAEDYLIQIKLEDAEIIAEHKDWLDEKATETSATGAGWFSFADIQEIPF